jgi:hypothetical protein
MTIRHRPAAPLGVDWQASFWALPTELAMDWLLPFTVRVQAGVRLIEQQAGPSPDR